jgi:hypothetical protein
MVHILKQGLREIHPEQSQAKAEGHREQDPGLLLPIAILFCNTSEHKIP